MSKYTKDGHPLASGSVSDRLTGKYGPLSVSGTVEGVIDKAYYPDDQGNTSKKYMEYSVVVLNTKTTLPTVRHLLPSGGFENGEFIVLNETTGTVDNPQNPNFDRRTTDSSKWNGDRIILGFVGVNINVPVITGIAPHPATKYGGKRKEGSQRKIVWNGTEQKIDKDGNASTTLKDGKTQTFKGKNQTVTIDDDKKTTTIDSGSGAAVLVVDGDNKKTTIKSTGSSVLELGAATDYMLLGTTYRTAQQGMDNAIIAALDVVMAELTAASGSLAMPIIGGPAAAPHVATAAATVNAIIQAIQTFENNGNTYLSTKNKLD